LISTFVTEPGSPRREAAGIDAAVLTIIALGIALGAGG
jgi:hypothetical protein